MGRLVVLVPAGGRGERFGGAAPKQLLEIAGRPVLRWTLERLMALAPDEVVVALPRGVAAPFSEWGLCDPPLRRVDGGSTRQESVLACLAGSGGEPSDLVMVHDGARPAVSMADLLATLAAARETGAAVLGRAMSDTVKRLSGSNIVGTLDRGELFRAETPQVFRRDLLERAFALAVREGRDETDESAAVERLGGVEIRAVVAESPNPKLTVAADFHQVARLLGGE